MAKRQREPGEMVRLALDAAATPPPDGDAGRYVDVVASTAALDRDGEIVQQDWLLEGVESVPVYWEHNFHVGVGFTPYDPRATLPIGFATNLRVEDGTLKARLNFIDEAANPLAPMVFEGFKQKSIRQVSVGFMPGEVQVEEVADGDVLVLSKNELREISACGIGVNKETGVEAISAKSFAALRARANTTGKSMTKVRKKADEAPASTDENKPAADEKKACESCKAENSGDAKFCAQCGEKFAEPEKAEDPPAEDPKKEDPEAKSFLSGIGAKSFREAGAVLAGLKAKAKSYDALESRVAEIESEKRESEVSAIVAEGIRTGHIEPAKKSEYLGICGADDKGKGADPVLLRRLVKSLPKVVDLDSKGARTPPPDSVEALTPEQKKINKKLGISDEDFLKSEAKRASRTKAGG